MDLKSAYLPASSTSEILPPKEKMMLGYTLENVTVMRHPSVAEQFRDSVERTYSAIAGLANPQSDIGISSLAGPVDIGRVIYRLSLTDISLMLSFAVLLNINLAILNMLPIPVLDGGHIMFAIIEKSAGSPFLARFSPRCRRRFRYCSSRSWGMSSTSDFCAGTATPNTSPPPNSPRNTT